MAAVFVDGIEITLAEGERLNGVQAAARAGIHVPHYCWHPGLTVVASCRMCLVETGKKDPNTGAVSMFPKVVPACQTPATDGVVFVTDSDKVRQARAQVEEDLLLRHPTDCPICDKAGECRLQDYHFQYGREQRRADVRPFSSRRREVGETVTLFVDRCVMCTRCVRFAREISGGAELMVVNRGAHEEIDVFPGYPLDNKLSGCVVDLCPVGALGDVDFLYSQRVWFMTSQPHVCAGCSTGCSIRVDQNQDRVYRLKPRENPHVNQWWMCDDGRYGWRYVHDPRRVTQATRRGEDETRVVEWSDLPDQLDAELRSARSLAVVLSPFLTVEEAYLLATYARSIDPDARLVLGPVPTSGDDLRFPKGFTIRAEKCPNRRGVEAIIGGIAGQLTPWDKFVASLAGDRPGAIWITGGYPAPPPAFADEHAAATLANGSLLIVQDLFSSPLMERAAWRLPAAAFVERDGSYVNYADWLQSFAWAIRAPAGVVVDGRLYWRLSGGEGLYQARHVLDQLAREIAFFDVAEGVIPAHGIDLKINQLAAV